MHGSAVYRSGMHIVSAPAAALLATLVFLLALTPQESRPARPETHSEIVDRFVKGEDALRPRILKAGTPAMHALLKHRRNPRGRELMREIRRAAASEADRATADLLLRGTIRIDEAPLSMAIDLLYDEGRLVFLDPAGGAMLWNKKVKLDMKATPLELLEEICAQADADFAYLYGGVIVAAPDRLWPREAPASRPLSDADVARARVAIGQLGSDSPEERDGASATLQALGTEVLPLLDAGSRRADPEIAGRCRDLAAWLRRKPAPPVFGATLAATQSLTGEDRKLRDSLKEKNITFKLFEIPAGHALRLLLEIDPVAHQIVGKPPVAPIRMDVPDGSRWTVLALITKSVGVDFAIHEGKILIGPRADLEARLRK